MYIDGIAFKMSPNSAIFVPPNAMHQPVVDEGADLNVLVIYSPPGPEQKLRNKQQKSRNTQNYPMQYICPPESVALHHACIRDYTDIFCMHYPDIFQ